MAIENPIIKQLIDALMFIIPAGGVVRLTLCALYAMTNEDKKVEMMRRGKHVVAFVVASELVMVFVGIALHYFG